jgi:hypothetical protein
MLIKGITDTLLPSDAVVYGEAEFKADIQGPKLRAVRAFGLPRTFAQMDGSTYTYASHFNETSLPFRH